MIVIKHIKNVLFTIFIIFQIVMLSLTIDIIIAVNWSGPDLNRCQTCLDSGISFGNNSHIINCKGISCIFEICNFMANNNINNITISQNSQIEHPNCTLVAEVEQQLIDFDIHVTRNLLSIIIMNWWICGLLICLLTNLYVLGGESNSTEKCIRTLLFVLNIIVIISLIFSVLCLSNYSLQIENKLDPFHDRKLIQTYDHTCFRNGGIINNKLIPNYLNAIDLICQELNIGNTIKLYIVNSEQYDSASMKLIYGELINLLVCNLVGMIIVLTAFLMNCMDNRKGIYQPI